MKKHNTKKLLIIIIVLFISIGFAVLTSNLNVATTLTFRENVWDIHYENLKLIDCSSDNPTLTLDNDKDEITIGNTFDIPTDYIEFSFVVLNAGTIDAVLNQINVNLTTEQQKYIEYSFKYVLDDSTVAVNDKLFAGQGKLIKARFSYKYDINEFSTLSNTSVTITFKYIQPQSISASTWNYEYTGTEQVFYVPKNGTYKIEAWGASGGDANNGYVGGAGAYVAGNLSLTKNTPLYINVGGKGLYCPFGFVTRPGGYNGGGDGKSYGDSSWDSAAASGGGATSICNTTGLLKDLVISNVYFAAGGGGGGHYTNGSNKGNGGAAGYTTGLSPTALGTHNVDDDSHFSRLSAPGTQSSGGCAQNNVICGGFGYGGNSTSFYTLHNGAGSGGGAGIYGGSGANIGPGAGGASYIISSATSQVHYDGNESMPKYIGSGNMTGNSSNGYVKITFVS